jgi:hypothetical protein
VTGCCEGLVDCYFKGVNENSLLEYKQRGIYNGLKVAAHAKYEARLQEDVRNFQRYEHFEVRCENILLILVIFAPSILEKCSRCVEASTTAMFISTPISFAFFSAAATAILAPCRVSSSWVLVAILVVTAVSLEIYAMGRFE